MAYITNQKLFLSEIINNILPLSESLKILVGYFYFSGFEQIYKAIENKDVKILVGLDIEVDLMNRVKEYAIINYKNNQSRASVRDKYLNSLKDAINETNLFDSIEKQEAFEVFLKKIQDNTLQIKKTLDPNHAKLYLFKTLPEFNQLNTYPGTVITGSSNLTLSGLKNQKEINHISREPSFAYDTNKMYCEATTFLMTGKSLKYLIAILNSKPATFFFKQFYAGGGLGESGYRYKKAFLEQLPIPPITPKNQHIVKEIESLVNQILQYYRNTDKCSCNTDIPVCEDEDQDIPICEDEDQDIPICEGQSTSTANRNTDKCSCNPDKDSCNTDIPVCENIGQNNPVCRENYEYSKENLHITNRNLPHWTKSGAIYWITFRLADSLPHQKLEMWRAERDSWLKKHPKPWSEDDTEEYNEKFNERLEKWLDSGYGSCILTNPAIRKEVIESILKFDGQRLKVHSAVIMPNHVHLLLEPFTGYSLSEILKGIKGASAQKVNKFLETKANKIWMEESYDHIVRSEKEYFYFIRYIVNNPIRANLPSDKYWLYISNNITQTFPQIVTQAFLPVDNKYTQTSIAQTGMSMLPQEYEHQIDQLVYKLYGLSDEEIRLIEGNS
ncbi:MAG TPA: TaqI-like C-terminal specificity domain-containing protein [Caldisericia bacterium]|nr:TaqI-like C-terminal specificity domain-containing protein [Caldisericia bacterium]